jgi:hypothetical protein
MGRSNSKRNNLGAAPSRQATNAMSAQPLVAAPARETTLEDTISRLEADSWSFSPAHIPSSRPDLLERRAGRSEEEEHDEDDNQRAPLVTPAVSTPSAEAEGGDNEGQQQGDQLEEATISNLVEHIESHCYTEIMIAAGLSYFSDAINIVATFFLALPFEENEWHSTIVASSIFMGSLVGTCLSSCYFTERYGSRRVFVVTAALRPVLGLLTLVAFDFPSMVVLRFLVGIMSCGRIQAFQVLDEFSSSSRSKAVWVYMQFFWSAGIIVVSVIESILAPDWRSMVIWTEVFVAIASAAGIFWLPDSPSWLLRQGYCEPALLSIGNRSGPDFDWLVAIQPNPPSPEASLQNVSAAIERRKLWGIWLGFGMTYFGIMYLINAIFHGSNEYYGTIMASAELEVFGILLGWFGSTRIGARWVQIIGFFIGGTSVTLIAAWEEDHATAVAFAIIGRISLMAGITSSLAYAMEVRISNPLAVFTMAQLGALGAPLYIDSSWTITVSVLAFATLLISYCSWSLPEQKSRQDATTSFTYRV